MTAKEQLRERVEAFSEQEAAAALRLLDQRSVALAAEHGYPSVLPARPGRPMTQAEFEEHFGDLPTDDEP